MKYQVNKYLLELLRAGSHYDFCSVTCTYGKFTIYCLLGPEEKILQITFAPERHTLLRQQLQNLARNVRVSKERQRSFLLDGAFADYFSGRRPTLPNHFDTPLLAAGTDFQHRVWHHISQVPYGSTITYQELAEAVGSPKGARAAGMACGANPLALIIPCHRIVAKNGLGGFAGPTAIKAALLSLEQGMPGNRE